MAQKKLINMHDVIKSVRKPRCARTPISILLLIDVGQYVIFIAIRSCDATFHTLKMSKSCSKSSKQRKINQKYGKGIQIRFFWRKSRKYEVNFTMFYDSRAVKNILSFKNEKSKSCYFICKWPRGL